MYDYQYLLRAGRVGKSQAVVRRVEVGYSERVVEKNLLCVCGGRR